MARYHVRTCTHRRQPYFRSEDVVRDVHAQLLHSARDHGFDVAAYCYMPDHVHVLLEAVHEDAALGSAIAVWKQRTGFEYLRRSGTRLWQVGYFERVLRESEPSRNVAEYILANPVRAGLARSIGEYPFAGCIWTTGTQG